MKKGSSTTISLDSLGVEGRARTIHGFRSTVQPSLVKHPPHQVAPGTAHRDFLNAAFCQSLKSISTRMR